MAVKKIAMHLVFLGIVIPAGAQTGGSSSLNDMIGLIRTNRSYIQNQNERYEEIDGTPYLDEEFNKGSLYFGGRRFTNIDMRYNIYQGHFEFMDAEGVKYIDPRTTLIDTVWLNGDIFLYVSFESGKNIKMTYMKLVRGEGTRVLLNHRIVLSQAEPAKGYQDARPARFSKGEDLVYIQPLGSHAMEFKGKKSIEELFPEYHQQLSAYVKSEKLKLKKLEDILKLVTYYDNKLLEQLSNNIGEGS